MLISNTVPNSIKSYSTYCGVECRLQSPLLALFRTTATSLYWFHLTVQSRREREDGRLSRRCMLRERQGGREGGEEVQEEHTYNN